MAGFFSTSSSMRLTPGSVVEAPTGTTAPFSAMSGPVIVTAALATGALPPSAFIRSAMFLASKAALFQSAAWAAATPGSRPSVASMPASWAERASMSRRVCMVISFICLC